ncbi:MAG: oxygen-independent coproporphyrinogen III oxidase [Xanthobacteraceae bacterium]
MDTKLLQYLQSRVPRYTSYPTAVQFIAAVNATSYREWLAALSPAEPLSVYLHVPFCAELCLYCGCHTTVVRRYDPVAEYVDLLEREIGLVDEQLTGRHRVTHVHWGGGTPTMLSPADFERIMARLDEMAPLQAGCEVAIEIDPRTLKREFVTAMANAGVTRASLGVQDFEERVQRAVGRIQSFERTAQVADWLRSVGIENINLDLMYGLPYQTAETVAATVRRALELEPDRVALFGYAHVPWMKRHQKLLPQDALPGTIDRLAQSRAAAQVLLEAGYRPIGLDHFARRSDLMVRRQREGRLHRNFQGYTTDEAAALIGFGTSAIGALPQGYVQNAASTVDYRAAIGAGRLATVRGWALTDEDRLRRDIIERLMCDLEVDLADVTGARACSADDLSAELANLEPMIAHGLIRRSGTTIAVPEHARPFVRNICMAFDAYSASAQNRYSRAM